MTPCILHKGCKTQAGYGLRSYKGKLMSAHRASYIEHNGSIPDGMVIIHACDNRLCINPDHLSVGTQQENRIDCVNKGRANSPSCDKHYKAKLTKEDVLYIRSCGKTLKDLSKELGVSIQTISDARRGVTWRNI